MRVRVCRTDEVPVGEMRSFMVEGLTIPVLIIHLDGEFLATAGMCPHEDVELADGDLDGRRVHCSGHGYTFDLDTGACTHDASLCLRRFAVDVIDGEVHIDLDLLKGPG